jgi:hypothetical protein
MEMQGAQSVKEFGLEAQMTPGPDLAMQRPTAPARIVVAGAVLSNSIKTFLFTSFVCITTILLSAFTQIRGQSSLDAPASYLDPILIDLLAFSAAAFLVVEGLTRLAQNRNLPLASQLTRTLRVAIGCGVMTIHVIQFLHK